MTNVEKEAVRQLKISAPYTWACTQLVYDLFWKYHPGRHFHPTDQELLDFFARELEEEAA